MRYSPPPAHRFHQIVNAALGVAFAVVLASPLLAAPAKGAVARQWNEALLDAIRLDYPAPTVHSRNLFHLSAAMWDAWAAYTPGAVGYYWNEHATAADVAAAREQAISHAAYGILTHRFTTAKSSPDAAAAAPTLFGALMDTLGYDKDYTATSGGLYPAAELGNRIAAAVIAAGSADGANEDDPVEAYSDSSYVPVNDIMRVDMPYVTQPPAIGEPVPELADPNRWQPLALDFLILQNGIIVGTSVQTFLGSQWGGVTPFALSGGSDALHNDPGDPPYLGCLVSLPCPSDTDFKDAVAEVIRYSSRVDPDDLASVDISPAAMGNNPLGTNDGTGHPLNPATGQPYASNLVKRGDWGRVLAEFWADGPDSETPPGHWNTIANYVSDHPMVQRRFGGQGPLLDPLEWEVKLYFALNGALYDAAIAAWGAKRYYDYVRPITMIRYMGGKGQSSDPMGPSYHPEGLPLVPGLIEVISADTAAPGGRHEDVRNTGPLGLPVGSPPIGQIAIYAWAGQPADPETQYSGAEWIRAVDWLPYQRETFVTPPFAAYTSGHSAFSRAAAEVLVRMTGDDYFPGGVGTFAAPQDTFLEFEIGPSETIELQWATYYDAADEAGISRLWGGIHVRADDFAGRVMGADIGAAAFEKASTFFVPEPVRGAAMAALLALGLLARRRCGRVLRTV